MDLFKTVIENIQKSINPTNSESREAYCLNPWNYLRIDVGGDCYFCCPTFIKGRFSIGNVLDSSLSDIWNGKKAREFRQDVLNGNKTFCKTELCSKCYQSYRPVFNEVKSGFLKDETTAESPVYVDLSYDYSCNRQCIFCRDEFRTFSDEEIEKWDEKIKTHILPALKNAKIISFNGNGEFLDSKHFRKTVKLITSDFPNLKFEIISNGINLSEDKIKELNLLPNLKSVHVSMHSATRETYLKIFRQDYFDRVYENIGFFSKLKKSGLLEHLHLMFVVNSVNYKDMKKFVEIAENLDAIAEFSLCDGGPGTKYLQDESFAIYKKSHPEFDNFVSVINSIDFTSKYCNFSINTEDIINQNF